MGSIPVSFSPPLRTPSLQRTRTENTGEAGGRAKPSSGSARTCRPGSAKERAVDSEEGLRERVPWDGQGLRRRKETDS